MKNELTSFANPVTLVCRGVDRSWDSRPRDGRGGGGREVLVDVVIPAFVNVTGFDQASAVLLAQGPADPRPRALPRRPSLIRLPAFTQNWGPMVRLAIVGVYTVFVFSIPAILVWLRWLERRDSHHDAPPVDQRELRKMTPSRGLDPAEPHGERRPRQAGRAAHGAVPDRPSGARPGAAGGGDRRLSRQHAHGSLRPLGVREQRQPADVLFELRSQLGQLSRRLHREGAWRADARLGQRRRLSGDPLPGARRRQPRPPVQGLGAPLHGGEPVLVQRIHGLHRRPDRAPCPHRRRPAESQR